MHAEDAYLFRHALLRDAAYQLQLPADRARLHALAADTLESLAEGNDELADHWAEDCYLHCATVSALHENGAHAHAFSGRALAHALRAAQHFDRNLRLPDAVRFLEIAAGNPDCPATQRAACLTRICAIRVMIGPKAALAVAAGQLLALASDAHARAEALDYMALADSIEGDSAGALERTAQALAIDGLKPDSEIYLRLILRRASLLLRIGRQDEARVALETNKPDTGGAKPTRASAMWHSVWSRVLVDDDVLLARDAMQFAVQAFEVMGDKAKHAVACGDLAGLEERLGNHEQAERLFQTAIAASAELGDSLNELTFRHNHAAFLMESGRAAQAIPAFEANVAAGLDRGMMRLVLGSALCLAECLRRAHRETEVVDLLWSLRYEPMDLLEGERGKFLFYAAGALRKAGRDSDLISFGHECVNAVYSRAAAAEFNRYFTCAWTAVAFHKLGRRKDAELLAQTAMQDAERLQLAQRFHGKQRHPVFGEICAILGVPEPP